MEVCLNWILSKIPPPDQDMAVKGERDEQ